MVVLGAIALRFLEIDVGGAVEERWNNCMFVYVWNLLSINPVVCLKKFCLDPNGDSGSRPSQGYPGQMSHLGA